MAQNSPTPFPDSTFTHLNRSAEVVIVKKLRAFVLPGLGEAEPEVKTFQRDFFEFLGGGGLLIPCKQLDLKWQNPDVTVPPAGPVQPSASGAGASLYNHYFVSATARPGSAVDSVSSPVKGNADVITVRATVDTEGRGSCTVELACPQDKYVFSRNLFRAGQSVFEQNDMVFVSLPAMDGTLNRVFTGLVSAVRVSKDLGDTLRTVVTLECEDMLKLLTQSRTAVKPSLTPAMSDGKYFSGLDNDFSARLPHDIMSEILGLAYSDFYTAKGFYANLAAARANPNQTQAAVAERQLLKSMVALPQPASFQNLVEAAPQAATGPAYDSSKPFLVTTGAAPQAAPASIAPTFSINPEATTQTPTQIPSKIYGFRRARKSLAQASTSIDQALRPWSPLQIGDMDDLAFTISGTAQPNFQVAFSGSASLYFADYRSGLALCKQVAEDLNYEFFANQNGVVVFRPLNVSLPADFINGAKPIPTAKLRTANGRVGSEYWLQDKLMGGRPAFADSDVDIFTFAYVGSDFQITAGGAQFFKGVAFDFFKYLRFGSRTAPVVTKLQLLSDDACAVYANAYLSRLNASYSSARIQYTGDSRIQAGNPCYVQSRNTVYYVASVTHVFTAGQSYTMDLNLKYGRRPIAAGKGLVLAALKMVDLSLANFIKSKDLSLVLGKLRAGGSTAMAQYVDDNAKDLTFQGYVWEPLMPLDYESLYASLKEQNAFNATKEVVENFNFNSPAFTEQYKVTQLRLPALKGQPLVNATASSLMTARGIK